MKAMIHITRLAILFVLSLFCAQLSAQNLLDDVVNIRKLIDQDKYEEAYILLQNIEEQCLHSNDDSVKLLFTKSMGLVKIERKAYHDAIKYYESALQWCERLHIRDGNYVETFLALGLSYQRLGNDSMAEKYYRRGLLRTVNSNCSTKFHSSFYLNLGQLYEKRGDTLLASECFKRIDPQHYGILLDGNADFLSEDRESKALEMRQNGEFEQCLPIYDQLIERCKKIIGTNNEDYVRLLFSKALVLHFNLGRNSEAKPLFKELLEMRNELPGFNEDILVSTARYLQIVAQEGDTLAVDSILPMALSYASRSNNESTLYMVYRFVGNGFYMGGYYIQAIPYYEKYMTFDQKEDGLSYIEIPNMLAVCYLLTNSPDKARDLLRGLMRKYKEDIESHLTMKFLINHNYGRALMLCGQIKEAIDCFVIANKAHHAFAGEDNPKTLQYIEECKKYF